MTWSINVYIWKRVGLRANCLASPSWVYRLQTFLSCVGGWRSHVKYFFNGSAIGVVLRLYTERLCNARFAIPAARAAGITTVVLKRIYVSRSTRWFFCPTNSEAAQA
jgi:hypothetical protein